MTKELARSRATLDSGGWTEALLLNFQGAKSLLSLIWEYRLKSIPLLIGYHDLPHHYSIITLPFNSLAVSLTISKAYMFFICEFFIHVINVCMYNLMQLYITLKINQLLQFNKDEVDECTYVIWQCGYRINPLSKNIRIYQHTWHYSI